LAAISLSSEDHGVILIEIILLILLSRKMAEMCEDRELSKPLYIFLLILFWFIGEIAAAVIAIVISQAVFGNGPLSSMIYGAMAGWVGAACGAFAVFGLAGMQTKPERPSLFQIENELAQDAVRPRRRRKRREAKMETIDEPKKEAIKEAPVPTVKITRPD